MRTLKFRKKLKYHVVYSCRMHDIDWINENHSIFGSLCPLQNKNKIKNVAKNMIFQDFTERFSFGVLKSLSKIMKFAFFKVKPCQICEGILHLELFFLFLKKYKKWKHTYKPNVFCMILMKINVWSGCCYSQIHVLKKNFFENTPKKLMFY